MSLRWRLLLYRCLDAMLAHKERIEEHLAKRGRELYGRETDVAAWVDSALDVYYRAIRPAVIARKVSGGTRSARGSKAKSVLMSLFETWGAQGKKEHLLLLPNPVVGGMMHTRGST